MKYSISVVIPLFNKEKHIVRAINSILSQTYAVDEIIVVNDGSTDASKEKVMDLDNHQIRLIDQPNQGVSVARNVGINACKNRYIALLDADDVWHPCFIENIVKIIQKYPDAGLYATAYEFQQSQFIKPAKLKHVPTKLGLIEDYFMSCIKADLPITASSVVITKQAFNKVLGFPEGMKMGEDQLFWSRVAYHFPIAFINRVCVTYDQTITDSACKTNLITELAPHIKYWQSDLYDELVPIHMQESLKKLLHFSALYTVKNNLLLNNRVKARNMLFKSHLLRKDFYWFVAILLSFSPQFIIQRLN